MGANITIYCLEQLTDYSGFERLCHDLMAREGYANIEPLGSFKDKGRDAVHLSQDGVSTVFAYSVREDWRAKLAEDAAKIHTHKHRCDKLVFLTTAVFTAGERDEAKKFIISQYGWDLHLYGVERLRVLLEARFPDVRKLHPNIFPDHFYSTKATETPSREHLFISADAADAVIATWLANRLTAEGYRVWYEGTTISGAEPYPADTDSALREGVCKVIALYSQKSLNNPDLTRQRNLALSIAQERKTDFLVPLNVDGVQLQQLDRLTASLNFISFESNWAQGLRLLLRHLDSSNCAKPLVTGRTIAAAAFLDNDVLAEQAELVYSNCFRIETIPRFIHCFETSHDVSKTDQQSLLTEWAFRSVNPKAFVSFHHPNNSVLMMYKLQLTDSVEWVGKQRVFGLRTNDLVSELLRKAIVVKCYQKGLQRCQETGMQYFPIGLVPGERIRFTRPDSSKTHVQATGKRKYWRPQGAEYYLYYLSPTFSTLQNPFDNFTAILRVRVRITDANGKILPKRVGNSRRKHLCQNWWNAEWFNRVLAIGEFLADNGKISIGDLKEEHIIIDSKPISMVSPISINESALGQGTYGWNAEAFGTYQFESEDDEEGINYG